MGIACLGRIHRGRKGKGAALYRKVMYTCFKVQYKVEGRPIESLWVKLRGDNSMLWGILWWVSATGLQTRKRRPSLNH